MFTRLDCAVLLLLLLPMQSVSLSPGNRSANEIISTDNVSGSRRDLIIKGLAACAAFSSCVSPVAVAAESSSSFKPGTVFLTGRFPKVPGDKPRDPSDTKGTRKDTGFLRSVSDCKSKCERTPGPGGLARSKEDCLSECQDICCTTYEQCTFGIVPRI